jgi:hypothetical protein
MRQSGSLDPSTSGSLLQGILAYLSSGTLDGITQAFGSSK